MDTFNPFQLDVTGSTPRVQDVPASLPQNSRHEHPGKVRVLVDRLEDYKAGVTVWMLLLFPPPSNRRDGRNFRFPQPRSGLFPLVTDPHCVTLSPLPHGTSVFALGC